ncbi:hypothetical protein [Sphingopyxis sp.]|uniref:hypothetical protein n=1 Tax=Sphingopyxis sp. TaxID=1908224 RepID=UPI0026001F83|nr:hypothetical protein [Sphingopyxis sp.]MBK6414019.1 hypothetical protein [Sphingopyxis sp.]
MPFSSGTYSVVYNWTTESAAAPIEIAKLDQQDADMAAALSTCLLRDGTGLPTASIPFNSQRLTGLGDATAATDALNRQTADARYLPSGSLATDRLLGRDTAGTGAPEALTVSGGIEFTGTGGIQRSALTGDVTASAGSNATTIANDAVSYAKMQNVSATSRVLGRVTAGAGDVEELTPANLVSFITTADGAGSGLDADLLDGQSGAFYQSASNLNAGTIPDARIQASGVTQHQGSLAIAFTQLTGTIANAQVPAAAVTQHQAALSIAASQLTGTLADARVAQSNVTQHQAALGAETATVSTLARRNVNGYLFASYYNQSSSAETPTIGNIIVEAGADGYFRKSTLTHTKRQIVLNCTIQSDPGGTPSGTAGDVFFYY